MRMVTNPVHGSMSLAVRRRATATWVDGREEMFDVLSMISVGPREQPGFAFDERLDVVGAIDGLAPVRGDAQLLA